ncbi:MAG: TIR domain-containing protein [Candidatus Omnitrophota bacterium]
MNQKQEKRRVLIVEDTEAWRHFIKEILEEDGYDVTTCKNREEAMSAIEKQYPPFHVAVLDIRLDDGDKSNYEGLEIAYKLKRLGEYTKAIILTGYPKNETMKKAFKDYGVFDYLEKVPNDSDGEFKKEIFIQTVHDAYNAAENDQKKHFQIFLSYSRNDEKEVQEINNHLEKEGFNVYMDTQLLAGDHWERVIRQKITDAHFLLTFFSKKTIYNRGFFQKELRLGEEIASERIKKNINYLIPVLFEDCRVSPRVEKYHRIELYKPDGINFLKKALLNGIERYKGRNRSI